MMRLLILLILAMTVSAPCYATGPTNTSGPWGIDAAGFKNLSTALASPLTSGQTVIVSKPMNINNKTTDRAISVTASGRITVGSGKTFTSTGLFQAGLSQVFDGPGSISLAVDTYLVWMGSTVSAFDRAVAATPVGKTLYITKSLIFSSVATVNKNINVIMAPGVELTRTGAGVGIDFTGQLQKTTIDVTVVRSPDWTAGNIGIRIKDSISSVIKLSATGFEKGLCFYSAPGATIYDNTIYPGQLFTNQYGMYFDANGGSINANRSVGGRWSEAGTFAPALNRYGIYHKNSGTNVHYAPLIEILSGGTGKAYTMFCEGESKHNRIVNGYAEAQDYALGASGTARWNKVIGTVATDEIAKLSTQLDDTSSFPGLNTIEWENFNNVPSTGLQDVFSLRGIHKLAIYEGSGNYSVPGLSFRNTAGTHSVKSGAVTLNENSLGIGTTAIGRAVDTTSTKQFWLTFGKLPASTLEVVVVAFDTSGNILSGGTHVKGVSLDLDQTYTFNNSTDYGGSYLMYPNVLPELIFFSVEPSVASIWVGGRNYENSGYTPITGISLRSVGDSAPPESNPGYDLVSVGSYDLTGTLAATAEPAGGVFSNGTKIGHLDAVIGEPTGWVITNRRTTSATSGEPAGETVVAVASITSVATGDVLGVIIKADADNTTRWHWTTVNGAPTGGNITMSSAVPSGYTITSGAKVITYKPRAMTNL